MKSIDIFNLIIFFLGQPLNHLSPALAFFANLVDPASIVDLTGPLRWVTAVTCSDGRTPCNIILYAMLSNDAPLHLLTSRYDRVVCQDGRGCLKNKAKAALEIIRL